jgi:hypothetical protein
MVHRTIYRLLAVLGLGLLLMAGLLAWQGERALPLWLGGAGMLLLLPLLHRRHRAEFRLPREVRERMHGPF